MIHYKSTLNIDKKLIVLSTWLNLQGRNVLLYCSCTVYPNKTIEYIFQSSPQKVFFDLYRITRKEQRPENIKLIKSFEESQRASFRTVHTR